MTTDDTHTVTTEIDDRIRETTARVVDADVVDGELVVELEGERV